MLHIHYLCTWFSPISKLCWKSLKLCNTMWFNAQCENEAGALGQSECRITVQSWQCKSCCSRTCISDPTSSLLKQIPSCLNDALLPCMTSFVEDLGDIIAKLMIDLDKNGMASVMGQLGNATVYMDKTRMCRSGTIFFCVLMLFSTLGMIISLLK